MAATIYKAHKTRRDPPLLRMRDWGENTEKQGVSATGFHCSHFFLSFTPSLWDMV